MDVLKKVPVREQDAKVRATNFEEVCYGYNKEEAMKEVKMVVEGVYSAKAALALAQKYQVQIPIIEQVNAVLFDGKEAGAAVKELMIRDKKLENSDLAFDQFIS